MSSLMTPKGQHHFDRTGPGVPDIRQGEWP